MSLKDDLKAGLEKLKTSLASETQLLPGLKAFIADLRAQTIAAIEATAVAQGNAVDQEFVDNVNTLFNENEAQAAEILQSMTVNTPAEGVQ